MSSTDGNILQLLPTLTWWNFALSAVTLFVLAKAGINMQRQSRKKARFDPLTDPQSVETSPGSGVYKCGLLKDDSRDVLETCLPEVSTLFQAFLHGMKVNENGRCLGSRSGASYTFIDYEEVFNKSHFLSSAFVRVLGLKPVNSTNVAIYAKNCQEWFIATLACARTSMVTVPLYDTLGAEAATFVIQHTGAEIVLVDNAAKAEKLLGLTDKTPSLKHIVLIEGTTISDDLHTRAKETGVELHCFADLLRAGEEKLVDDVPPSPDDVHIICYTSGTTGTPKGVMLTHRNIVANISAMFYQLKEFLPELTTPGQVVISYLPLSHMFEQCVHWATIMMGGTVGYSSGSVANLSDDLKALKPTLLPMVPRLLNKFDVQMRSKVRRSSRPIQWLFDLAYSKKLAQLKSGVVTNSSIWDLLVFNRVQEEFGGNVKLILTGSAPISAEVLESCRVALGAHIVEGYGQTEATAMATITWPGEAVGGHCGGPAVCSLLKLEDVPDLNYYAKDRKGEILIKGPSVTPGYYKDAEKTAELFDSEGFLHTGDVGHLLPTGAVKIIDRRKHIFKLAQGEYVAPEKIENVYIQSHLVQQVYVDGDSLERYLIAVVVPNAKSLTQAFKELGCENGKTLEEICKTPEVISYVLGELQKTGKTNKLNSIEQVKAIHLEIEPFTVDNGLLTPTLKAKRPQLRQKYQEVMKQLYKNNPEN